MRIISMVLATIACLMISGCEVLFQESVNILTNQYKRVRIEISGEEKDIRMNLFVDHEPKHNDFNMPVFDTDRFTREAKEQPLPYTYEFEAIHPDILYLYVEPGRASNAVNIRIYINGKLERQYVLSPSSVGQFIKQDF